jgi:hypothetical protein
LLAPEIAALAGVLFTFFGAIALVLVLSIGFDYAVFCREAPPARRAVTMLGVCLAMLATLLSFGLLGSATPMRSMPSALPFAPGQFLPSYYLRWRAIVTKIPDSRVRHASGIGQSDPFSAALLCDQVRNRAGFIYQSLSEV